MIGHRSQNREDVAQEVDGDRTRLIRPGRREEDAHPRRVAHEVITDLVGVDRACGPSEVVDRLVGTNAERETDVAELKIQVDEDRLVPRRSQRNGEIGRDQRLARPALRPQDADHRSKCDAARNRGAAAPRHRLLERESDPVGFLREGEQIVGSRFEDATDEAVR